MDGPVLALNLAFAAQNSSAFLFRIYSHFTNGNIGNMSSDKKCELKAKCRNVRIPAAAVV